MDFALNEIPMEGYICPLETTLYQEETMESIVPDACPDILSIVTTEGRARLTRKESLEGKAEAAGNIQVTVLYLPENEPGPRKLELNVPFRVSVPAPGLEPGCPLVVVPRVCGGDTRMLNPRKVLCRVELAVFCQGWAMETDTVCSPFQEPEAGLQQRVREMESYVTVAAVEKSFAFTDEVNLTASRPAARELLGHRVDLQCGEAKVIGNKLIFKGEAALQVRYRTAEDGLAVGRWDLPFSQIVEVSGVEEEGTCVMEVVEQESQVTLTDDAEGRTLAVHLELLAQAVIRQTRQVRLFTDAYSVTRKVTVERRNYQLQQLWEENATTQAAREVLETPVSASRIEDCFLSMGMPQVAREESEGILSVQGKVTVLYTGEDGALAAVTQPVSVSVKVALPPEGKCRAKCDLGGDIQAVPTGMGIEVRCPIRFGFLTTVERPCMGITAIQAEEQEDVGERPSVILRLAQPGECLWDIAKTYSTTQEDILAANDLPEPDHLEGKLLLIPRSR